MPWIDPAIGTIDGAAMIEALSSLDHVSTKDDFLTWTQSDTQRFFPHRGFLAVTGKVFPAGIRPLSMISVNIPESWLTQPGPDRDRYQTPWMRRWLQSGEPQMFDLARDGAAFGAASLTGFRASGLHNVAAHGLFDIQRDQLSFFSFHGMPFAPAAMQGKLLKLMVAGMHDALLRCMRPNTLPKPLVPSPPPLLTERENEVLSWICQGKTNSEIASILQISPHTVKNQAQNILVKMKVNTRAQASAEAMRRHLVQ
jgi:DNA-binding CsgD family transcriptional regulator